MNVTKQYFVERRVMSKQELAHLYCPHSRSKGHAARDEFIDWVKRLSWRVGWSGGIAWVVVNNFTS